MYKSTIFQHFFTFLFVFQLFHTKSKVGQNSKISCPLPVKFSTTLPRKVRVSYRDEYGKFTVRSDRSKHCRTKVFLDHLGSVLILKPSTIMAKLLASLALISLTALLIVTLNHQQQDLVEYEIYENGRETLAFNGVSLAPSTGKSRATFTSGVVSGRLCAATDNGACNILPYAEVRLRPL